MNANPFSHFIAFITEKHGEENWVTVYENMPINGGNSDGAMFSALVKPDRIERVLSDSCWDLIVGAGAPGFCTSYENGESVARYYTNSDEGYLRLVLNRQFHGRKEDYVEVLEEFRLFHNLYYDHKTSTHIAFDDSGDEIEVVKCTQHSVQIRRSYLRSFMAARQMHLLLFFENTLHFKDSVNFTMEECNSNLRYSIYSGASYSNGFESFSRIIGKKLSDVSQSRNVVSGLLSLQKNFKTSLLVAIMIPR